MSILNFDRDKNPTRVSRLLSFGGSPNPKRNIVFGAIALVALAGLGSTLAANINLNSGSPVEFGQGIAQTTACDSSVAITPFATFINASGGGDFALQSITVSEIDSSEGACLGKDFTIKAFGDSSDTQLPMVTNVTSLTVADDGTTFTIPTTEGVALTQTGTTSFTLTFDPTRSPIATTSVYKFTVESSDHTEPVAVVYAVGDPGPGGGKIFYYLAAGFSEPGATCDPSCHYLEWAPNSWNNGSQDPALAWATDGAVDLPGASGTGIGEGFANTAAMATLTSPAAAAVLAYPGSDSSAGQWFIPSFDELALVYDSTLHSSGGFMDANNYWTSYNGSENGGTNAQAWVDIFDSNSGQGNDVIPNGGTDSRTITYYVRPIRAF